LLGGGLFALVAITNLNWYYPTLFYVVAVYIAWQRYFSTSIPVGHTTTTRAAAEQEVSKAAAEVAEQVSRQTEHTARIALATAELYSHFAQTEGTRTPEEPMTGETSQELTEEPEDR